MNEYSYRLANEKYKAVVPSAFGTPVWNTVEVELSGTLVLNSKYSSLFSVSMCMGDWSDSLGHAHNFNQQLFGEQCCRAYPSNLYVLSFVVGPRSFPRSAPRLCLGCVLKKSTVVGDALSLTSYRVAWSFSLKF